MTYNTDLLRCHQSTYSYMKVDIRKHKNYCAKLKYDLTISSAAAFNWQEVKEKIIAAVPQKCVVEINCCYWARHHDYLNNHNSITVIFTKTAEKPSKIWSEDDMLFAYPSEDELKTIIMEAVYESVVKKHQEKQQEEADLSARNMALHISNEIRKIAREKINYQDRLEALRQELREESEKTMAEFVANDLTEWMKKNETSEEVKSILREKLEKGLVDDPTPCFGF